MVGGVEAGGGDVGDGFGVEGLAAEWLGRGEIEEA